MFGYFLRGVDKRFQLERSLGLISDADLTDAASRLEKLFHEVRACFFEPDPFAESSRMIRRRMWNRSMIRTSSCQKTRAK